MTPFVVGTLILTISNFFIKTIEFLFKTVLFKRLGPEGTGFYRLSFSLYAVLVVLSNIGISTTVSKLISEKIGKGKPKEIRKISKIAIFLSFVLSLILISLTILKIDYVSLFFIKNEKIVPALVFLIPSVYLASVSSTIKGYFFGTQKTKYPAISEVLEQIAKILFTFCFIAGRNSTLELCKAAFLAYSVGELISHVYLFVNYFLEAKKFEPFERNTKSIPIAINILKNSLPLGIISILESIFLFSEDMIIIQSLKKFGLSSSRSLAEYGIVNGMAMPLIYFPLTILFPFVKTLTPEISRYNSPKGTKRKNYIISKSYNLIIKFSFFFAAFLFVFSNEISEMVYANLQVSSVIREFCVICPLASINLILTAILDGLNRQVDILKYSITTSFMRIVLLWYMVPKFGIKGLVFTVLADELLNCFLNINKVNKICEFSIEIYNNLLKPVFISLICILLALKLENIIEPYTSTITEFLILTLTMGIVYFIFLNQDANIKSGFDFKDRTA